MAVFDIRVLPPDTDSTPPQLSPRLVIKEPGAVIGLHLSPRGEHLACVFRKYASSEEDTMAQYPTLREEALIHIYQVETGSLLLEFHGTVGYSSGECTFLILPEFSPCGRFLSCGSEDGTTRIWSIEAGALIQVLKGHTDVSNFCAWHPNEPIVITGSDDLTLRLWTAPDY